MINARALVLTLAAASTVGLAACSSSSGPASSSAPAGSTTPSTSTSSNPCAALAGRPVGSEVDASNPNGGHLANPPAACDTAADLSDLAGCYPGGTRAGDWFTYQLDDVVAFGRPGHTWQVKHGQPDRTADAKALGC